MAAMTPAERAANRRARADKGGRKLYRGSVEFYPPEHALMCLVAAWIAAQRVDGTPSNLDRLRALVTGP